MKSKAGNGYRTFFRDGAKIPKILLQIAPPVMLAQLIQAMYNIVDRFFCGKIFRTGADGAFGQFIRCSSSSLRWRWEPVWA